MSRTDRRPVHLVAMLLTMAMAYECPVIAETVRVERQLEQMGTRLTVSVDAEARPLALEATETAISALEAVEARLSTWRQDTELSRLNACPAGVAFSMSSELRYDLESARRWFLATDAAFDPAMGALSRAWGLRTGGCTPDRQTLAWALKATGFGKLRFEDNLVIRLPGVTIDEGGFGKGVGLDAAIDALGQSAARGAVIDLGGQLALYGDIGPVEILVAHPDDRDRPVLRLTVNHGSVATSGNSEQSGHLIDPRSGRPVHDFGSVTVWARDATAADCLSTGLYVLGPEDALQRARNWPGIELLVLEKSRDGLIARCTPGLTGLITVIDFELRVKTIEAGQPAGTVSESARAPGGTERKQRS